MELILLVALYAIYAAIGATGRSKLLIGTTLIWAIIVGMSWYVCVLKIAKQGEFTPGRWPIWEEQLRFLFFIGLVMGLIQTAVVIVVNRFRAARSKDY